VRPELCVRYVCVRVCVPAYAYMYVRTEACALSSQSFVSGMYACVCACLRMRICTCVLRLVYYAARNVCQACKCCVSLHVYSYVCTEACALRRHLWLCPMYTFTMALLNCVPKPCRQSFSWVGQNHTYIRCIYGIFGRKITNSTFIYGACIMFCLSVRNVLMLTPGIAVHNHFSQPLFTTTFHNHCSQPLFTITFHNHCSQSLFTIAAFWPPSVAIEGTQ